jgi:ferredoxin
MSARKQVSANGHNPHGSDDPKGQFVAVDYDHCSYCGACVAVCPPDCITLHDATLLIDTRACTLCRRCIPSCPTGALTVQSISIREAA